MKLYVLDDSSKKICINQFADTKERLLYQIGYFNFKVKDKLYNINDIHAEYEDYIIQSVIVASLIGIFFGPFGIATGAVIGFILGEGQTTYDKIEAQRFNDYILKP